jgi:dTDP-4-amino-4,6-dideoxygalactose transaminase
MLRLSMASVDAQEEQELRRVLRETVNFGLGVHVAEFEKSLSLFLDEKNSPEVVCVNTGTAALHATLECLGFPKGSEVLVPSITFLASFSAISAAGLVPVATEVVFPSGHICPEDCEKRISSKTVAIMPVAYSGSDFSRHQIYEIAQKYSLRVVEDDAHAFGGDNTDGMRFGSSGDVVCFSFDGIKNITCGEGGAVVTRDKNLAHKLRVLRALGIEKDVELRYQGKRAWEYDVQSQGFRYHMSNINASIGVAQLRKINDFKLIRSKLFEAYLREINLNGLQDIVIPTQVNNENYCFHIFPCILGAKIDRAKVREKMRDLGFETGIHYAPNHLHSFYKTSYSLKQAEKLGTRLISLPFHTNMRIEDVVAVCKALKTACAVGAA